MFVNILIKNQKDIGWILDTLKLKIIFSYTESAIPSFHFLFLGF